MAHFGVKNTGAGQIPAATTVTNSSTEMIAANTARKWCYMTNVGNKDVFVALGQTALVDKGILLCKAGGSTLIDATNHCTEAMNGITDGGSSKVITLEGI